MTGSKDQRTGWLKELKVGDYVFVKQYRGALGSVKDTYNRAKEEWKDNIEYMTELALVVNHKSWQYAQTNETLSKVYVQL